MEEKRGPKGMFDVPWHMALILAVGNLGLLVSGIRAFELLHFERPIAMEMLALVAINPALLWFRWRMPRAWSKLTGEQFK